VGRVRGECGEDGEEERVMAYKAALLLEWLPWAPPSYKCSLRL